MVVGLISRWRRVARKPTKRNEGGEVAAGVQQERKPRRHAERSRTDRSAGKIIGHDLDARDASVRSIELFVVDQRRHQRDD